MSESKYRIQVEGENDAETGRYARDLRDALLNEIPNVSLQGERANPEDQSSHDTIFYVVGTAFYSLSTVLLLVKTWQASNPRAHVKIHDGNNQPVPVVADDDDH